MQQATSILQDYHHRFPLRPGMPKVELGSRLKLGKHAAAIWQKLFEDGILCEEGLGIRLPSYSIQLTPAQQDSLDLLLRSLNKNPYAPVVDQMPTPDLLNLLIAQQQVVKVSDSVVFSAAAYGEMVEKVTAYIKTNGQVTLAEVRDIFNTSRKYAQAFLEHLDEKKVTRRTGDQRVLY